MSEFDSLRISGKFIEYEKSKVAILSLPYEQTTTWKKGTSKGPQAIIEAYLNMELFDDEEP